MSLAFLLSTAKQDLAVLAHWSAVMRWNTLNSLQLTSSAGSESLDQAQSLDHSNITSSKRKHNILAVWRSTVESKCRQKTNERASMATRTKEADLIRRNYCRLRNTRESEATTLTEANLALTTCKISNRDLSCSELGSDCLRVSNLIS